MLNNNDYSFYDYLVSVVDNHNSTLNESVIPNRNFISIHHLYINKVFRNSQNRPRSGTTMNFDPWMPVAQYGEHPLRRNRNGRIYPDSQTDIERLLSEAVSGTTMTTKPTKNPSF